MSSSTPSTTPTSSETASAAPYYFSTFHDFTPDPTASLTDEFSRLALQRHWGKKTSRKHWKKCVTSEFQRLVSGRLVGLDDWVALCLELRLVGDFTSITKCKKALKKVHVNIADLLDARTTGATVQKFKSLRELKNYTKNTHRVFPKQAAKQDKLLKILLRRIV